MHEPPTIDYATPKRKPTLIPIAGVVSIGLCLLQFPWAGLGGWVAWAFVWGDNQPTPRQFAITAFVVALPCLGAIVLSLISIVASRFTPDRIAAVLGLVGGVVWATWLIRNLP